MRVWRYWDVQYEIDFDHSPRYFERRLTELLEIRCDPSARDVPVGAYVSGGVDSSLIAHPGRASGSAAIARLPRPLHRVPGL